MNAIAEHLWPQDVLLDLDVATREDLFTAIGRHMRVEHGLAQDLVAGGLLRRERAGSTALGQGVAIPHARIEGLNRISVLYARLKIPIAFDAPDKRPVSDVLVLLVPYPATDQHLRLIADASQMFSDRRFRERLRSSAHVRDIVRLFADWPGLVEASK